MKLKIGKCYSITYMEDLCVNDLDFSYVLHSVGSKIQARAGIL